MRGASESGLRPLVRMLRWAVVSALLVSGGCLVTEKIEYSEQDVAPVVRKIEPLEPVKLFPPFKDKECGPTTYTDAGVEYKGAWVSFTVAVRDVNVDDELRAYVMLNGERGPYPQIPTNDGNPDRVPLQFCIDVKYLKEPCNLVEVLVMRPKDDTGDDRTVIPSTGPRPTNTVIRAGWYSDRRTSPQGCARSRRRGRAVKLGPLNLLVLGLLTACEPEQGSFEFPKNHCSTVLGCGENARCMQETGLCAAITMTQPYTVVLQISPNANTSSWRYTWKAMPLATVPREPLDLEIPNFVETRGLLHCNGKPIMAEILFLPISESGYPIAPVSVRSDYKSDLAATTNFVVRLPPAVDFDVRIQPLSVDSAVCPPFRTTFPVAAVQAGPAGLRFEPEPPSLRQIRARLVEDTQTTESGVNSRGARQVRVVNKNTREVVSSTLRTQIGDPEGFTLEVISTELAEDTLLQVDLDPAQPWQEAIEVPLPAIPEPSPDAGVEEEESMLAIRIPAIPARVTFTGSVELKDLQVETADQPIPDSDLTFTSTFPVNSASGGGDRDWCQLRKQSSDLSPVACRAQIDSASRCGWQLLRAAFAGHVRSSDRAGPLADPDGKPVPVAVSRQVVTAEQKSTTKTLEVVKGVGAVTVKGLIVDHVGNPLPNMTVQSVALGIAPGPNDIRSGQSHGNRGHG